MKKCPYCSEEIPDEAIKCKHCGSNITPPKETWLERGKRLAEEKKEKKRLEEESRTPRQKLMRKVLLFGLPIFIFFIFSYLNKLKHDEDYRFTYGTCLNLEEKQKNECIEKIHQNLLKTKRDAEIQKQKSDSETNVENPCYSGWNGVHKEGEKVLKSLLKDSTSYEYTNTIVGGKFVKILFVAKNSFGAKGSGEFTFTTDDNCSVLDYKISNY